MPKITLGNPYQQKYTSYVDKLFRKNVADLAVDKPHYNDRRDSMRTTLADHQVDSGLCIATTGSDGRLEKKGEITSPVEGVILVTLVPKNIREKLTQKYILCGGKKAMHVEVKEIIPDTVSYLDNKMHEPGKEKRNIAWPTRVMDLYPLSDDPDSLIMQAKQSLGEALIAKPNYGNGEFDGARIRADVNSKFKEYVRVMKRGGKTTFRGNDIEHYNAEEGVMYFNKKSEDSIHISSVKYGPLRSVQLFTALKIIDLIREKQDASIMESVDHRLFDKLEILESCRVLNESQVKEIYELYKYFLWCYSISEYTYSYRKETEAYLPDVQLFKENIEHLVQLLKK